MKLGTLKAVGHNIADSLASGVGLPIGVVQTDVFAEAQAVAQGYIEIDFLRGVVKTERASPELTLAAQRYRDVLPELCSKHGVAISEFAELTALYGVDAVYGRHFSVKILTAAGTTTSDHYIGVPGRRMRRARR